MLRRIATNLKAQNWFAVFVEILIVTLGIFFALQADNWNERRKDRIDEQVFLTRLHEDILLAEELTDRVRDRRLNLLNDLFSAADVVFGRSDQTTMSDDLCDALAASHYFNVSVTDLPALAEMMSTGRMSIIQEADLLGALVAMQQTKAVLEFLVSIQIVGTHDLPSKYPDLMQLEAQFDGDEAWSRATCKLEGMQADQRFLNDISENIDRYDAYVRDALAPWSEQVDRVHELVDRTLELQH